MCCLCGLCPVAEYYVSPRGSDANPGTREKPWQTIGKANASLKPGDTVHVLTGTYHEEVRPKASGTADGGRITYRALRGHKVNARRGIQLKARSYVTVDGIDVIDPPKAWGSMDEADHCIVQNSTMKGGTGWTGFGMSGRFSKANKALAASQYNVFRRNKVYGETHNDSLNLWWNSHHNLVEDCQFVQAKHILISLAGHGTESPLKPHHNVIRNNFLKNTMHTAMKTSTGAYSNLFGGNFIAAADANGLQLASSREIIRNNIILKSGAKRQWTGAFGQYTNVYKGNWFAGFAPEGQNSRVQDCRVYSNTAVGNQGCAVFYSYSREGARQELVGRGLNVYVNNIMWRNGLKRNGIEVYYTGASWSYCNRMKRPDTYHHNLIGRRGSNILEFRGPKTLEQARKLAGISFENNVQGDPLFTGEEKEDYRLRKDSRCVDAGRPLTRAAEDGEGTTLKVKDATFFCDGWGIVEPDTIQVGEARVRIKKISDRNTIILGSSLKWKKGTGVSLPYAGKAPDIGARESGMPAARETARPQLNDPARKRR